MEDKPKKKYNSRLPYNRKSKHDIGNSPITPCNTSEWKHMSDLQKRHFTTTVIDMGKMGVDKMKHLSQALVVAKSRARQEWLDIKLEALEDEDIAEYTKLHRLLLAEQRHCHSLEGALGLTFRSSVSVTRENASIDKLTTKTAAEKAGIKAVKDKDKRVSPLKGLLQTGSGRYPRGSRDNKSSDE